MKDLELFKQSRNLVYYHAQPVTRHVTDFDITYKVYKSFAKRMVVLNVITKYHDWQNYADYILTAMFGVGELGEYEPQRFEYAKFSFDRFSTDQYQQAQTGIVKHSHRHDYYIDLLQFESSPYIVTTLEEVNQTGVLPGLDLEHPNVILVSYWKGILEPEVRIENGLVRLDADVRDFEPIIVYYNSKLTVYVTHRNDVTVDNEIDVAYATQSVSIPLDITKDELRYLQYANYTLKTGAEVTL